MKKIGMVSLGCPKNLVDTEAVLGDLKQNGYELTSDEKDADILIVNTCGFLQSAVKESIDTILEMAKYKTDGRCKRLIVTGCLAERHPDELLKEIPEIDHLHGVQADMAAAIARTVISAAPRIASTHHIEAVAVAVATVKLETAVADASANFVQSSNSSSCDMVLCPRHRVGCYTTTTVSKKMPRARRGEVLRLRLR